MNRTLAAALLLTLAAAARADILLHSDNTYSDEKILSQSPAELLLQPADKSPPKRLPRAQISRTLLTDDHGALLPNPAQPVRQRPLPVLSPEPTAPPLAILPPTGPTYYLIPLHGEVGATILASALEKSLADAAIRNPTVVVLDINSPGGLVEEAEKILKVLHHYNRTLRIVALTDQDLSAAAILTLSVKEIYVKPSSTIGAAVSFIPTKLFLPPKLEEKFQSAWRAVARNSAEEGGHEPLLADAMIDNSIELHIETSADGKQKPLVKEGPAGDGQKSLLHKGKILTLTSHEALDSGLAAGEAEDLDDLGKQLHLDHWTECKGLGTALADYIPQRAALFKTEVDKIATDLAENLTKAQQTDPTQSIHFSVSRPHPIPAPPPAPMQRGLIPTPPAPPPFPTSSTRVYVADRLHWKQKSLACVVSLQACEQNLQDAIALSDTFGQETTAEALKSLLAKLSEARANIFDNRNKYGEGVPLTTPTPNAPTISATRPASPADLARSSRPLPILNIPDAEAALAAPDSQNQSRAANFLRIAAVDPAEQKNITTLLLPFIQAPDSNRQYIFMEAFAHWASKDEAPVLANILATPARSDANPNPQNRYWPPAITALVHLDPAAAESILQQRKSEFFFRSKITFALQSLIDANSPDKAAAQHLLDVIRPSN